MLVLVRFENAYSDGVEFESTIAVPAPPKHGVYPDDVIDAWFDEVVYEFTGGYEKHTGEPLGDLGSCYTATVVAADDEALIGLSREWID